MLKKYLLGLGVVVAVLAGIIGMSAFEAHVINVTAKIENALKVNTEAIEFGTVFPQEELDKPLTIQLSDSFVAEEDADDVDYIIRQKPKCGWTIKNGTVLVGPTATGEVKIDANGDPYVVCPEVPALERGELPEEPVWGLLPSLCEYISKEPDMDPTGTAILDDTTPSFHKPYKVVPITDAAGVTIGHELVWNDTKGRLAKSEQDVIDNWTIDLSVPCFGDYCAQDWETWVKSINPDAIPSEYTQPIANEHKIFGCDLWVEVTGISRVEPGD